MKLQWQVTDELTVLIGLVIDLGGTIWVLVHRYSKGDINRS